MKMRIVFLMLFSFNFVYAINYGPYKQFAAIDFDSSLMCDSLKNSVLSLQNGASFVFDIQRNSQVLNFDANQKSYFKFDNSPLNDTLTLAFWYKLESSDSVECWRMFFSISDEKGNLIYLTPKTPWNDKVYLIYDFKSFHEFYNFNALPANNYKWTHYVVQFVANRVKIYQNGELVNSSTIVFKLSDLRSPTCYFGCNPKFNFPISGKIDDLKIFHCELAENQIKAIYNNQKIIPSPEDFQLPYIYLPLKNNVADIYNNVQPYSKNLNFITDTESNKVAQLNQGGYIKLPINPFGHGDFSLSFMFKKNDFMSDEGTYLLLIRANDNNNLGFRIKRTKNVNTLEMVQIRKNVLSVIDSCTFNNPLLPGRWNNFVFCKENDSVFLVINAQKALTVSNHFMDFTMTQECIIGSDSINCVDLKLSEFKIYHRLLTNPELLEAYNNQTNVSTFTADFQDTKQIIHNFGSSDGWNTQNVGRYFDLKSKNLLAQLLFSTEKDTDGNPKGIGLSAWRFNIGAGTAEQGSNSRINIAERRTECFLNADGTYNWNKQSGQRWFLEAAAKTFLVPCIIGWQNSPPVYFTVRKLGFREYSDEKKTILSSENYQNFGKFLSNVIMHFKQEGVNFNYISPLNEPQWNWSPTQMNGNVSQEGTPWTNEEIYNVSKAINDEFQLQRIETKLLVGEAGKISHLLAGIDVATNQLSELWDSNSTFNISKLPSISRIVSAHSYFEDTSANELISNRKALSRRLNTEFGGLQFWQTEYSLLGSGYKFGFSNTRTLTPMESAIALSRVIHADLTQANASAWQWWTTFEFQKYLSIENRFALIRVAVDTTNNTGAYQPTKLLYTLGNYAHFIRPGFKRLNVTRSDNVNEISQFQDLMVSAFVNESATELIYVVINSSTSSKSIILSAANLDGNYYVNSFTPYITSDNSINNLKKYPSFQASDKYLVPAISVVTFVGKIDHETANSDCNRQPVKFELYPNPAKSFVNLRLSIPNKPFILKVIDICGRVVLCQSVNPTSSNYRLNIGDLYKGVYCMSLSGNDVYGDKKLIVK